jgi:hypothetical protein
MPTLCRSGYGPLARFLVADVAKRLPWRGIARR